MHYAKFRHHEDAVAPGVTSPHPKTPSRHIEIACRMDAQADEACEGGNRRNGYRERKPRRPGRP